MYHSLFKKVRLFLSEYFRNPMSFVELYAGKDGEDDPLSELSHGLVHSRRLESRELPNRPLNNKTLGDVTDEPERVRQH